MPATAVFNIELYAIKNKLGLTSGHFVRAKITQQVELIEAQESIVTSTSFMKMFVDPSEIYLYRDFVDFRKAINGLAALVEDELNCDAYTG